MEEKYYIAFFFPLQGDRMPLHSAAYNGHVEVLTKLLESGADPGVKEIVWGIFHNKFIAMY